MSSRKVPLQFISDAEIERVAESITLEDVHRIIKLADRIFSLSVKKGLMEYLEVELAGDSETLQMAGTISHPHEPDDIETARTFATMIAATTLLAARRERKRSVGVEKVTEISGCDLTKAC